MKKLYVLLFFCVCFSGIGWGQGTGRKSLPKDWHLRSFEKDGVTSRAGVKVSSPNGIYELGKDAVYFDDLCASGGIVNALESVKLAEKLCKK